MTRGMVEGLLASTSVFAIFAFLVLMMYGARDAVRVAIVADHKSGDSHA